VGTQPYPVVSDGYPEVSSRSGHPIAPKTNRNGNTKALLGRKRPEMMGEPDARAAEKKKARSQKAVLVMERSEWPQRVRMIS
jgi:hypothetical protein